jgi:hypothetical protein
MFNLEKKIRVALLLQIAALSFSISKPARAISEAQLFNEPAFVNLYGVILRVNTSMKIAAMNPMDRWRRQAVREAVAQIPPALIGLAEVFESGKLHDGDYQYVMGMLGGFVDQKSAPEIYSKFLKKPSSDLIPKAGSGMQARLDRESGSAGSRLVYDDNAPSPEGKNAPATAQNNRPQNKEVVNLSSLSNYDDKDGASSSSKIVYDESAAAPSGSSLAGNSKSSKGVPKTSSGSQASSSPTNSISTPSRAPASSGSFVSEVQSEISVIEAGVKKDEEAEEETLPIKRQSRAKAGRPGAKPSVAPKQGKPVSQNSTPSQHLASMGFHAQLLSTTFKILPLFYPNAFAAEGQSNCQSCQKGGGQGGGGGGGEGGGGGGGGGQQAAQLLFGAAAIMAAIVPAIVASEQADADKEIAQTNAEAQKYMTDAVAQNSENLAAMQQQTAMYQTQVAAQTAAANNEAVSQRLNQQLQQLDASQQRIAAQEQQQFMAEQELNQKRLELSEAQLAANVAAAQAAQQLQLTQAGLSTGTLPGDSGSSLTTSSTGVAMASATGPVASTESTANTTTGMTSAQTPRGMASTNSGSALPTSTTGVSGSTGYATGATGRGMTGAGHETAAVEGAISKPPSDTVVMADTAGSGSSDSESSGSSISSAFASLMPSAPATASARLASSIQSSETNFSQSSSQESQIARLLKDNKELNGSSRGMKVKAAPVPQSSGDLRKFIAANDGETKVESESFAQFQEQSVRHQSATRGLASTSSSTKSGHGGSAAAPVSGMASRGMAGRPAAAAYNPPAK